ncbi:MAG: transcription elongation factor GreA [Planctomycetota bacterium]
MAMLTEDEKKKLESQLEKLIANRPVISERIAEARALGDLKENAEYHAAREQQGLEEAEIRRIEERLAGAQVVDAGLSASTGVVFLGSTVKLKDVGSGEEETFRLVGEFSGEDDEDVIEVTASSPMGEALLKARVGETVRVNAPRGVKRFEIIELI